MDQRQVKRPEMSPWKRTLLTGAFVVLGVLLGVTGAALRHGLLWPGLAVAAPAPQPEVLERCHVRCAVLGLS